MMADINRKRGFALMPLEKRIENARKGGINAHKKGTSHEFTSEEAREAGRKGGLARAANARNKRIQAAIDAAFNRKG